MTEAWLQETLRTSIGHKAFKYRLAHPIHVEQGTDDSRKVIYDTRTHLHQTTGNFLGCLSGLKSRQPRCSSPSFANRSLLQNVRGKLKVSPCLILYFRFSDDTVVEVMTNNKLSKEYDCSEKYEIGALVRTHSSSSNRCASHRSRELLDHTTVGTHQALSYCHKKSLPHSLQKNPCIAVSLA